MGLKDKINLAYHRYRMERNRSIVNSMIDRTGTDPVLLHDTNERFAMASKAYHQSKLFLETHGGYISAISAMKSIREQKQA